LTEKIYIRLIDGVETFVPVQAVRNDDSTFKIIDNDYLDLDTDVTSIWEFFPGDIVTCKQKEDYLLASELLGYTFPNRRLHQLIFLIVENFGNPTPDKLAGFDEEMRILTTDKGVIQIRHPMIKKWLINQSI
jgi:hypothetical protein